PESPAGPVQVPRVDHGAVGDEQLDHRVVEVQVDLDVAVRDLPRAQVQHGGAAAGPHLEVTVGGPVAELFDHLVVGLNTIHCGLLLRSLEDLSRTTTILMIKLIVCQEILATNCLPRSARPCAPTSRPSTPSTRRPR